MVNPVKIFKSRSKPKQIHTKHMGEDKIEIELDWLVKPLSPRLMVKNYKYFAALEEMDKDKIKGQELTKAEEQIMLIIWEQRNCFVKEILVELPEPKPAYNTVSTIVRILEKKNFVSYNTFGKTHQYYPTISKEDYKGLKTNNLMSNFFGGSAASQHKDE